MKLRPDALIGATLYLSNIEGGTIKPASLHDKVPQDSPILTGHAYETLASPTPDNTRYYLGDALNKLDYEDPSPEEAKILIGVATYDAKRLLAEMLPPDVIRELDIAEDIGLDKIVAKNQEGKPYTTPYLKDILLLANACDSTGDSKLHDALEYILDHAPDDVNAQLMQALEAAKQAGTTVMQEYRRIQADTADRLDGTGGDDQTQEFIELMRKATVTPIGSLERLVKQERRKKAPPEEGGTGYIAS
jgi:hypothetical protein